MADMDAPPDPLSPEAIRAAIRIEAAQLVGTNLEMTYRVDSDAPADAVDAALEVLLRGSLGLYAVTRLAADGGGGHRYSVMASPLDRLFHKIGPGPTLAYLKHYAQTMQLSDANAARQVAGLLERGVIAPLCTPPPWDAAKALATLAREPSLLERHPPTVFGVPLRRSDLPFPGLATLPERVAAAGGVELTFDPELLARFG